MNKSKTKQRALFNTGNQSNSPSAGSVYLGWSTKAAERKTARPWHSNWRLAAHKLHSPQNGLHNAHYPMDRRTAWLKDRPIIGPRWFKDRQPGLFYC